MSAANGSDAPEDDPSIDDETELYRRVPPAHWKRVGDEYVVRDSAFKNHPNPEMKRMSVVLGDTLEQASRNPESVRSADQKNYGVVAIRARIVREHEQVIERSPQPNEPAHGDVYGEKPTGRRKKLVAAAEWIVYPE